MLYCYHFPCSTSCRLLTSLPTYPSHLYRSDEGYHRLLPFVSGRVHPPAGTYCDDIVDDGDDDDGDD